MIPKIVFSDFDGTLTWHEQLGPVFFDLLQLLKSKNIPLVIVTGRSLSWGHFLLTHFEQLEDVIVEGGGSIVSRRGKIISENCLVSEFDLNRLKHFADQIPSRYGFPLSADSFGRKTDRAIELYDLKANSEKGEELKLSLKKENINFSTSNVHLNFWAGEISKWKAVEVFLQNKKIDQSQCVYFGDSLNDQSMFKVFDHSVGVSNIKDVLDRMEHRPRVILEGDDNVGPYGVLRYLKSIF